MGVRRRALLLALAGSALPIRASAQSADALAPEILAIRERIRAATGAKDRASLEALYRDDFMHLRDSGRADLKAERIEVLLSGDATIETAPEAEMTIQVYGTGTAVATGASDIKDAASGRSGRFRWLVVYVKGAAGWQVALSQAYRAAPAPRP